MAIAATPVLGLLEAEWVAITGIGTAILAVATCGMLFVIWQQLSQSRRAHVEGLIERGSSELNPFRSKLGQLDFLRSKRAEYTWDELGTLREIFVHYDSFLDLIRLGKENGGGEIVTRLARKYAEDLKCLARVLRWALEQNTKRLKKFEADAFVALEHFLGEWDVPEKDRVRARELMVGSNNLEEYQAFIAGIKRDKYARDGRPGVEIDSLIEAGSKKEFDPAVFEYRGGDVENMENFELWSAELRGMLQQGRELTKAVLEILGQSEVVDNAHS